MEEFARELQRKLQGEKVSRSELLVLADRLREAAVMVGSNLQRASTLMGDFKTLAVDQGSEDSQLLDLPEYLRAIVLVHQPVLRSARVQVQLDLPERLSLRLAGGLLSQVVSNLLLNAVNHAFEPGQQAREVRISLSADERGCQLALRDNGRGVPAEQRAQLFEAFYTTKRGAGGSGLGLHIVQTLCRRMGGEVSLDPREGPGLGFLIRLPRIAH
jgi:signal transduction histidine kinase